MGYHGRSFTVFMFFVFGSILVNVLERLTLDQEVPGSSPGPPAIYSGTAELWANDSKLFDVEMVLTGYVKVVHIKAMSYEAD